MDIEGGADPTIIHSTSSIVNVCKSCGESDYLFDSEASARKAREREKVQREKDKRNAKKNEEVWDTACRVGLGTGLLLGILAAVVESDKAVRAFSYMGVFGVIVGVVGTWRVSWMVSLLKDE